VRFSLSFSSCNRLLDSSRLFRLLSSALSLRIYGVDVTPHAKGKPPPQGPGTASDSLNKKREVKEEETSGEGKEPKQEDKDEVKQEAEGAVKTEEGQADAVKVEA